VDVTAVDRLREEVGTHNRLEEDGHFPVLRRHGPDPPLDTLLAGHEEIRIGVGDFAVGMECWRRAWS